MTTRVVMNVDLSDPSDIGDVVERMIEHAVEVATEELNARIAALVEERDNLTYELIEAHND